MIEIKIHVEGALSAMRHPQYHARMRAITRRAHKATISRYIRTGTSPGFGDRFDYARGARFQFTRREPKYENAQRKVLGRPRPYYSPTRRGGFGTGHLANMIKLEGRGHRIRGINNQAEEVRTRMTFPYARVLNLMTGRGDGDKYRAEFLRFGHPSHEADMKLLQEGVAKLIQAEQEKLFRAGERRLLRVRKKLSAKWEDFPDHPANQ